MRLRVAVIVMTAVMVAAGLFWVGCTDDTIEHVTPYDPNGAIGGGSTNYFPLTEGYQLMYEVADPTGGKDYVRFEVGGQVQINDHTLTTFIEDASGTPDTTYFENTSSGLYFYSGRSSSPRLILAYPVRAGLSWSQTDGQDTGGGGGFDDLVTGDDDTINPEDSTVGDGGALNAPLPLTSGTDMVIVSIGQVTLSAGKSYSGAVKVTSTSAAGTSNDYWFVPGIGLVKYIVGMSSTTGTSNATVGTLVSYGY